MKEIDKDMEPAMFHLHDVQVLSISQEWKQIGFLHNREQKMIVVMNGRASFRSGEKSGMLGQGDVLITSVENAASVVSLLPITQTVVFFYVALQAAHVSYVNGNWQIAAARLPIQGKRHIESMALIQHQIEQLQLAWKQENQDQTALQVLFMKLWRAVSTSISQTERQPNRHALLLGIAEHMKQHFAETFQIEEMARYSGMTPTVFYQQFKEVTSLTPLQYINRKRMEKACELLAEGRLTIPEVASEVGYRDVYYFSRMFKKGIGVPPNRFMKSLRMNIAVLHPALVGDLLALGVPVRALIPVWEQKKQKRPYSQIEAATSEFDLYRLRQMGPDLIVGTNQANAWHEQLSQIAPTQLIPFKQTTWREHLRLLAEMLGIEEVANSWLYYYDLKVAAARERIRKKIGNETVIAVRTWDEGARLFGAKRRKISDILYGDLQVNAPKGMDRFAFLDVSSLDELQEFQADHILLFDERKQRTDIRKHRLRGNVHHAEVYPWLHYSALGHEQAITEALVHFAE